MNKVKEEIERWMNAHPGSPFASVAVDVEEKTWDFTVADRLCKLFLEENTLKPMHLTSEAEELSEFMMLANMHVQMNPQRGLTDFLTRAEGMLDPRFKQEKQQTEDGGRKEENMALEESKKEELTTKKEEKEKTEEENEEVGNTIEEEEKPDKEGEEEIGLQTEGAKRVKREIEDWKEKHGYMNLNLLSVHEDRFQVDITLGPEYYPCQIFFSHEWTPMFVAHEEGSPLEAYITPVNATLAERSSENLFLPVREVLNMIAAKFNASVMPDVALPTSSSSSSTAMTNGNDSDVIGPHDYHYSSMLLRNRFFENNKPGKEEPFVDPSLLDWEENIIPELRVFMGRLNFHQYEVEEWVRRIRNKMRFGNEKALQYIVSEVLGPNRVPSKIRKFFPVDLRRGTYSWARPQTSDDKNERVYMTPQGSKEATERLKQEMEFLKELGNTAEMGFTVAPSGDDLYHWKITLLNFDYETKLGEDLTEYALRVDPTSALSSSSSSSASYSWGNGGSSESKTTQRVKQAPVIVEMKFPIEYPHIPPVLRLVRPFLEMFPEGKSIFIGHGLYLQPPFNNLPSTLSSSNESNMDVIQEEQKDKTKAEVDEAEENEGQDKNGKTRKGWDSGVTIYEIVRKLRKAIIKSEARVDMSSATVGYGLPTINNFWREFRATTPTTIGRSEVERGGKIILPQSVIEDLASSAADSDLEESSSSMMHNWRKASTGGIVGKESTIFFELSAAPTRGSKRKKAQATEGEENGGDKATTPELPMYREESLHFYCGVLEFTSQEEVVCVPRWILDNLGLDEGARVQLRRVELPKGKYTKLQPHEADFVNLDNPKAVLEWVLPNYVALFAGETLSITHAGRLHKINVLEVAPGTAISLIDTNVDLEFAPPLRGQLNKPSAPTAVGFGMEASSTTTSKEEKEQQGQKRAREEAQGKGETAGRLDTSQLEKGVDYKVCDNCLHEVALTSYDRHALMCARLNWCCPKCSAVVRRTEQQQHMEKEHTPVKCDACGEEVDSGRLEAHRAEECKFRMVACEYCEMKMPYVEKWGHEMTCGEITEFCPQCKQRYRRKDAAIHPAICGEATVQPQLGGGRVSEMMEEAEAYPLRKSPSMFMCPKCRHSCPSFDDLQVHMLTAHHDEHEAVAEPKATTTTIPSSSSEEETKRKEEEEQEELRECSNPTCHEKEKAPQAFQICSRCQVVQRKVPYCSAACQTADWRRHKLSCGKPEPPPQQQDSSSSSSSTSTTGETEATMDVESSTSSSSQ